MPEDKRGECRRAAEKASDGVPMDTGAPDAERAMRSGLYTSSWTVVDPGRHRRQLSCAERGGDASHVASS